MKTGCVDLMIKTLSWRPLCSLLRIFGYDKPKDLVQEYLRFVAKCYLHKGWPKTVKICKDLNSRVKLAVLGKYLDDPFLSKFKLKIDKRGIPRSLPLLSAAIISNPRAATNVANLVYLFRLPPDPSVETITSPYTGCWDAKESRKFVHFLTKVEKIQDSITPVKIQPWHGTLRSGPNSFPAVITAGRDPWAFTENDIEVMTTICQSLELTDILNSFLKYRDELKVRGKPVGEYHLAKLAFLSDKAGKTRVVYILNYWHQQIMLSLHDNMMNWLGQQKQDATWDQKSAVTEMTKWTLEDTPLFSFDLTAATDRWPMFHQKLVIHSAYGDKWTYAWERILSIPAYNPFTKAYVSYSVGQPMGAYASWSSLAMTHHMLVRYAAWNIGVEPEYKVLGDDIVIRGRPLATEYLRLLKLLGVTISEGKSLIPKDGDPISFEFAKNIVREGENLTAISPNLLKEIFEDHIYVKFVDFLREIKDIYGITGFTTPDSIYLPIPVADLFKALSRKEVATATTLLGIPVGSVSPLQGYADFPFGTLVPGNAFYRFDNPWKGIDQRLAERAFEAHSLNKASSEVKDIVDIYEIATKGPQGRDCGEDNLTTSANHPVWRILFVLTERLVAFAKDEEEDSTKSRTVNVEADFIVKLLKGESGSNWKTSKLLRSQRNLQLAIELHKLFVKEDKTVDERHLMYNKMILEADLSLADNLTRLYTLTGEQPSMEFWSKDDPWSLTKGSLHSS
jgi:hypothetical protein